MTRRSWAYTWASLAAASLIAGGLTAAPVTSFASNNGIVTNINPATGHAGASLFVNGNPWRAIGVNLWDMDALNVSPNPTDPEFCVNQHPSLDTYLDTSLQKVAGDMHATAVRTFSFIEYNTAAGADWSVPDKWIYYANKWNVRIVPSLGAPYHVCGLPSGTPSFFDCVGAPPPGTTCIPASTLCPNSALTCNSLASVCPVGTTCYLPGYLDPGQDQYGVSYRSYVLSVIARYAGRPEIAYWQLMNEGDHGSNPNSTAMHHFLADLVPAIHAQETAVAGAGNDHLVNFGTYGNNMPSPTYGSLEGSDSSGVDIGDIGEAHDYPGSTFTEPAQDGFPLTSTAKPFTQFMDATGTLHDFQGGTSFVLDHWLVENTGHPGINNAVRMCVRAQIPASGWGGQASLYLDEFVIYLQNPADPSSPTPMSYAFEDGTTEGFTSVPPVITPGSDIAASTAVRVTANESAEGNEQELDSGKTNQSQRDQSAGHSLELDLSTPMPLPAGVINVAGEVCTPVLPQPIYIGSGSGELFYARAAFGMPISETSSATSTALTQHEALVNRGIPWFVGEAGLPADVPEADAQCFQSQCPSTVVKPPNPPNTGLAPCDATVSESVRATEFQLLMDTQLNTDVRDTDSPSAVKGSSGFLVWDWKDPLQGTINRTTGVVSSTDPWTNCGSVVPNDPSETVIEQFANQTPNEGFSGYSSPAWFNADPNLPPPGVSALAIVQRPPATLAHGTSATIEIHVTQDGNRWALDNLNITGGCSGTGATDYLGFARIKCTASMVPGIYTATVAQTGGGLSQTFQLQVT
ncbi:MAG: hypothetical protein ACYDAY_10640 [Candidatus Dormibacteria bacterium]